MCTRLNIARLQIARTLQLQTIHDPVTAARHRNGGFAVEAGTFRTALPGLARGQTKRNFVTTNRPGYRRRLVRVDCGLLCLLALPCPSTIIRQVDVDVPGHFGAGQQSLVSATALVPS